MPEKKETIRAKIARLEAWSDRTNREGFETINRILNPLQPTDDSNFDPRLQAQEAIRKATEDSAKADEDARERLKQIKKRY